MHHQGFVLLIVSPGIGGLEQDATAAAVASARIFLVLVSSAFLDSPYFDGPELQRALARVEAGAKARDPLLIPIYLRKCDWQKTELKKYAGLPRDGLPIARRDEDEHFAAIAEALRGVVEKLRRA